MLTLQVKFYISGQQEAQRCLRIGQKTGLLTVQTKDLGAFDGHTLDIEVTAIDSGSPPRSSKFQFQLVVNSSYYFPVDGAMYVNYDDDTWSDDKAVMSAALVATRRNLLIILSIVGASLIVALTLIAAILCLALKRHASASNSRCRRRDVIGGQQLMTVSKQLEHDQKPPGNDDSNDIDDDDNDDNENTDILKSGREQSAIFESEIQHRHPNNARWNPTGFESFGKSDLQVS